MPLPKGLSSADLQHGPIAMLDAATPALFMAAADGLALARGTRPAT